MEPETLTTERLLLRCPGPQDVAAVYTACQDPDIQRWTTIPSPYLPEHAEGFLTQQIPDGWRDGTMFNFVAYLRDGAAPVAQTGRTGRFGRIGRTRAGHIGHVDPASLVAMLGITHRGMGIGEIGFWATKEHRGQGYVTEATRALSRWAFTRAGFDRVEWRAEVGNVASRAVAEKAGFIMEGVLRSVLVNKGLRRDCWVGSLLPSDLGLPSAVAYRPYAPGSE